VTRRLVFLTGVLLVATTSAAVGFRAVPTRSSLAAHVIALTAPEMQGRASGTVGAERAARYLVDRFAVAGLRPGGDRGSFLQSFVIGSTVRLYPGRLSSRRGGSHHAGRARGAAIALATRAPHRINRQEDE
jgi:hypothetical protein